MYGSCGGIGLQCLCPTPGFTMLGEHDKRCVPRIIQKKIEKEISKVLIQIVFGIEDTNKARVTLIIFQESKSSTINIMSSTWIS
jgi:hypothetical protein